MQRPVNIMDRPIAFPDHCIGCGIGDPRQREYFVDIGIDIAHPFNPIYEGIPYLCNLCWEGILTQYYDKLPDYSATQMQVRATYKYLEDASGDSGGSPAPEAIDDEPSTEGSNDSTVDGDERQSSGNDEQTESGDDVSNEPDTDLLLELSLFKSAGNREPIRGLGT